MSISYLDFQEAFACTLGRLYTRALLTSPLDVPESGGVPYLEDPNLLGTVPSLTLTK